MMKKIIQIAFLVLTVAQVSAKVTKETFYPVARFFKYTAAKTTSNGKRFLARRHRQKCADAFKLLHPEYAKALAELKEAHKQALQGLYDTHFKENDKKIDAELRAKLEAITAAYNAEKADIKKKFPKPAVAVESTSDTLNIDAAQAVTAV